MNWLSAPIGPPIESEDQAKNWLIELVVETEVLRKECDDALTVAEQRQAFLRWLLKRGESLGALHALKRTGRISDVVFEEMRQRILSTTVPSVRQGVLPFNANDT